MSQSWHHIQNQVEINHILAVLIESLQIVWSHMLLKCIFRNGFYGIRILNRLTSLALMRILLSNKLEGKSTRKMSEIVTQQVLHPALKVDEVSLYPFAILIFHNSFISQSLQWLDHDTSMLSCQLICHLPQIDRNKFTLLPESKQLFCDTKRRSKPMQTLRLQLTQSL